MHSMSDNACRLCVYTGRAQFFCKHSCIAWLCLDFVNITLALYFLCTPISNSFVHLCSKSIVATWSCWYIETWLTDDNGYFLVLLSCLSCDGYDNIHTIGIACIAGSILTSWHCLLSACIHSVYTPTPYIAQSMLLTRQRCKGRASYKHLEAYVLGYV